jgi:hypothetical protein
MRRSEKSATRRLSGVGIMWANGPFLAASCARTLSFDFPATVPGDRAAGNARQMPEIAWKRHRWLDFQARA